MIRVQKPARAPAILLTDGVAQRQSHIDEHDADPDAFTRTKGRTFVFDEALYTHPQVKRALVEAQLGKCCFCEREVGSKGQVEHFRPKTASQQARGGKLTRPGYYWLAYEWSNLYLICGPCNESKRNLFPLRDPKQRARTHADDVGREEPLLIDPGAEDATAHIGFRADVPYAIDGSARGKATIDAARLDRDDLNEGRLQRLQILRALHRITLQAAAHPENHAFQEAAADARNELRYAVTEGAEFSAAARCAIADGFENLPEDAPPGARWRPSPA